MQIHLAKFGTGTTYQKQKTMMQDNNKEHASVTAGEDKKSQKVNAAGHSVSFFVPLKHIRELEFMIQPVVALHLRQPALARPLGAA